MHDAIIKTIKESKMLHDAKGAQNFGAKMAYYLKNTKNFDYEHLYGFLDQYPLCPQYFLRHNIMHWIEPAYLIEDYLSKNQSYKNIGSIINQLSEKSIDKMIEIINPIYYDKILERIIKFNPFGILPDSIDSMKKSIQIRQGISK